MKYTSQKYEKTLADLAENLVTPERFGRVVLEKVVEFPPNLRLCEPPENGWEHIGLGTE